MTHDFVLDCFICFSLFNCVFTGTGIGQHERGENERQRENNSEMKTVS